MNNVSLSRELLNQALEALEKTMNVWGGTCAWHSDVKHAITNLRAALAQEPVASASPEELGYVPLSDDGRSVFIDGIGEVPLKLEPAQEPVGQILPNWSTEKECIDGICAYLNDLGKNLPVDTLLYTAPPQRLPLTEEEMYAVEEEARKSFQQSQRGVRGQQITYWDGLTPWLIRAVERAHNIVE